MRAKGIVVLLCCGLFCSAVFGATVLQWVGTGVRDTDNSTLISGSPAADYYIMLVSAANGTTISFNPATQSVGAGETLLLTTSWSATYDYNGAFSSTFTQGVDNPGNGVGIGSVSGASYLYTVILNASTPGAGVTQYTILEGTVPTGAGTRFSYNSDLQNGTYTAPGNNTWQPVPEPSSIALLGLGLGLVALRRKMRK